MYNIQITGMKKLTKTDHWSATSPINGGINAPPTIAVTISPDNSFDRSGMLSMVIENINGKILAKPRPINMALIKPIWEAPAPQLLLPMKRPIIPTMATTTDMRKNVLGLIQFKITPPRNLPANRARSKNSTPARPSSLMLMPPILAI